MTRRLGTRHEGWMIAVLCTLVFAVGCKDDSATVNESEVAPAAVKPPPEPVLELPDEVLAVSGIPSLESFLATVNDSANTVAPGALPPNLASMAKESMKGDMGLTDISWFRGDAPVLVAVVDPKAFDNKNQVMLLPTSDVEKALASLKPGAQRDFEGHTAHYEHRFEKVYVDTIDGYLVFTDHTRIFPAVKPFLEKQLRLWKPKSALTIHIDMDHVIKRYGAEIAQGKEMLRQMAKQAAADEGVFDTSEIQDLQLALLFAMLESASQLQVDLDAKGSDLIIKSSVEAREGSDLATFLSLIAGKESKLTGSVPAGSWAVAGGHMDVRKFAPLRKIQEASMGAYVDIFELDTQASQELRKHITALADQSSGDTMTALYNDGEFPLAIQAIQSVEDVAAFRAVLDKLTPFLLGHGYKALAKAMEKDGTKLPDAQITSFTDLVGLLKPFSAPMGMTPTLSQKKEGGVQVDTLTLKIDWPVFSREMGLAAQEVETVKIFEKIVGPTLQVAFGTGPNRSGTAFGPNAEAHLLASLKGTGGSGDPTFNAMAKGQNLAMSLRLGALMRALAFIPDLAAKKPLIDAMSAQRALTMTLAGEGRGATAEIALPMDTIRDIVTLASTP